LAPLVIFADLAFAVEEIDLGAEEPVVVGRDDDGAARGADGGGEVEGEAFEGVDVDEVGADVVEPAEDELGKGGGSEFGLEVGEVEEGGSEIGGVEDEVAADGVPGFVVGDAEGGLEGELHAGAEVGDAMSAKGEGAGEFGDVEVVTGAFAFLEGEACPAEEGDGEGGWRPGGHGAR
jgi:hypothetical protein